jgi:hypothetical protein
MTTRDVLRLTLARIRGEVELCNDVDLAAALMVAAELEAVLLRTAHTSPSEAGRETRAAQMASHAQPPRWGA